MSETGSSVAAGDDPARDSADVDAVLKDRDLALTKRFIEAARCGTPANPARALKLLRIIATQRPVEGLFADASGFAPQDRAYLLAVAALERNVEHAAAILLNGIEQEERQEVARTFARQRLTSDVAQLISRVKPREWDTEEDRKNATALIATILSEFTRGADEFTHGGRQVFDVALVYVHLIGAGCDAEADALLTEMFEGPWRPGLVGELAREFDHYAPATDVLGDWARKGLSLSSVTVMAELLTTAEDSSRIQERVDVVGDHWRPKSVVQLCDELEKRGRAREAAVLRQRTVSRPDLAQVARAVAAWWGRLPSARGRDQLLAEAVHGRTAPRTIAEIRKLDTLLQSELLPDEARDMLRKRVPVDGCSGDDLMRLLFDMSQGERRDAGEKFARRMAFAAKERRVRTKAVVHYVVGLRRNQPKMKGSQTAANFMTDELVGDACAARVVAPVGAMWLREAVTRKDGESVLQRYLNKHSVVTAADVVLVFRYLTVMGMRDDPFVAGLAKATVGRWPTARRKEAAFALRDAGMIDLAQQVLPWL